MRLIEKVWFKKHPAKYILVPLLLPITLLFWFLSLVRRVFYSMGFSQTFSVSKPVIVVGNIGIGGNGKTPVVIYLVEQCRKLGLTPGVISRGYGGKAPNYPYMLDNTSTAIEAGDEPLLIYQRCNVPVSVGSNRVASAELLIKKGCNIIIADDGLQHYRLARELELVIVDNKRRFGNGLLLPAGPLREGKWRLATADFVILNGQHSSKNKRDDEALNSSCPSISMALTAMSICNLKTGNKIPLSEFIKENKIINAIAGIGDPQRFFSTLEQYDFIINAQQDFVDHHDFKATDFSDYSQTLPLVMTEKDAVKCRGFAEQHWWFLPVDAQLVKSEAEALLAKIKDISNI